MKKSVILFFILFVNYYSQTLIQTIPLPNQSFWNSGYGLVNANNKLWISSSNTTQGKAKLYGVDYNGVILDSVMINYPTMYSSQGLTFDGINFWYTERKTSRTDFFKISPTGVVLDSIRFSDLGGSNWLAGGCGWDGTGLWFSIYYPNNLAKLYKLNVTSKTIVDSISTFGIQPQGITVKGDTLFYVMDGFDNDPEKIYAVKLTTKDTLFSFRVPEQPGVRQNPRGLAWDGKYFWLLAEPVGASSGRALFKYNLVGSGTPNLNLITKNIDFGNVKIGSSPAIPISIQNYGTANLKIDSVKVSHSDFTLDATFPFIVEPNLTKQINVTFKPLQPQEYKDSVMFFTNDPNNLTAKTLLKGKGIYDLQFLFLNENSISFGDKRKNSTSYYSLEIFNKGSKTLKIDSINFKNKNFYFVKPSFPIVIDSIKTFKINIWFNPKTVGEIKDTIMFYSNASNGSLIKVATNGNGTTWNQELGNIVWQGIIPDNPATTYNDLSAKFFNRLKDVNGDGVDEVVVATDNYWTICYNGNSSNTADILWKHSSYPNSNNAGSVMRQQGLQVANDLNGDGFQDVVIGTGGGNESVYALNGVNGNVLWEFGDSVNYNNGDINGVDVKRDFNNDGIPDVLVSASGNESTGEGRFSVYCLNGINGNILWQINQSAQAMMKDAVISTDFGGAVGSRQASATTAEVMAFNKIGQVIWTFPTLRSVWGLTEIKNVGGNSGNDIIVGDFNGNVYAITADSGKKIWQTSIGSYIIEDIYNIPDVNNSGKEDIMVSALSYNFYILEGGTGQLIWTAPTSNNILGAGLLGDYTKDSIPEVGCASLDNKIYVFNSKTSQQLFTYSFGSGTNSYAAEQIWQMGDVDKNGTLEFVAGGRDGKVVAFFGGGDFTSVEDKITYSPNEFKLFQNYPNPFNPYTKMKYQIANKSFVSLKVYDLLGREIRTLVNEVKEAGNYTISFNADNINSGVYFYQLRAGDFVSTKKFILMK